MHRHQAAQARVLKAKSERASTHNKHHKRAVKQRPGPEAPPAHSSPAAPRIRVRYAVDVLAGRLHSSRASAVANPVSSQSARPPALTAASAPLRLLSPSSSPRPAQDPSPRPVRPLHAWLPRRRRQLPAVCCASLPPPPSLDLPLLPFQPAEVKVFGWDRPCLDVQI